MDNKEIIDFIDKYEADKKYQRNVFIAKAKIITKRFWYYPILLSIPTLLGIFIHPGAFGLYILFLFSVLDFTFAFDNWEKFDKKVEKQLTKDLAKEKYKLLKKKEDGIRQTLKLEELVKERELIDKAIAKLE